MTAREIVNINEIDLESLTIKFKDSGSEKSLKVSEEDFKKHDIGKDKTIMLQENKKDNTVYVYIQDGIQWQQIGYYEREERRGW